MSVTARAGILTEAVRRRTLIRWCCSTRSKKPTQTVHEIFFQVFDKGMMDDSEGRRIDFKNTADPSDVERGL